MLFDTPLLEGLPSIAIASSSTDSNKKRKRHAAPSKETATKGAEVNLDKLMKRMKKMEKDSGWGGDLGGGGKSGVDAAEKETQANKKKSKKGKGTSASAQAGEGRGGEAARPSPTATAKPNRFEPAKKDKRLAKQQKKDKKEAQSTFSPASSANLVTSLREPSPPHSIATPVRHAAPNFDEEHVAGGSTEQPKQTAMQLALRAKLAGGKFRMLNETLYTSTGEEAWTTMKEEGAFDDVRLLTRSLF
jgi:ribosomal RNA-processing protein 8